MTVGELRRLIAEVPDGVIVVLSKDAEGNSYSPAATHNPDYRYVPEDDRFGWLASEDDCPSICNHKDCDYGRGTPAFTLWPS